jgi:hypothetical protein
MTTTIKELQNRVNVAEAYHSGEQIQRCPRKYLSSTPYYGDCDPGKYNWDWSYFDFRVKKEA